MHRDYKENNGNTLMLYFSPSSDLTKSNSSLICYAAENVSERNRWFSLRKYVITHANESPHFLYERDGNSWRPGNCLIGILTVLYTHIFIHRERQTKI